MATIKDVANLAQVSTTTVSHVINNSRKVNDATRARVEHAMRELDFHPNALARSLRSGSSKTIGLIIPDIANLFFAEAARYIEDYGKSAGFSVILCNADNNPQKEASYVQVLIEKMVDGIIFISSGDSVRNLKKLQTNNIPVVIADRDVQDQPVDTVMVNNLQGGAMATEHLIRLGHRRIACISGPIGIGVSSQRTRAFHQTLEAHAIPLPSAYYAEGDFGFESGETCMRQILARGATPTAVFVGNDMMAFGAIRAIIDAGMLVPDDVSVIGFDDIPLARTYSPPLTTIAQPIKKLARSSVDLLVRRINKKNGHSDTAGDYQRVVLDVKLIERKSCRKATA